MSIRLKVYISDKFCIKVIDFSENREGQSIASGKKEKSSAAIKKEKFRWVFPCGKKPPLRLRCGKASAVLSQRKVECLPYFAIVSVK